MAQKPLIKIMKQNRGSIYLIDEENNLYVSGNNEHGRLGIDSLSDYISKITKVELDELKNNVASVNIEDTNKEYNLVTITTLDGKVFVAGYTGDKEYRTWIDKDEILILKGINYTVLGNSLHSFHELEVPVSEEGTYLFTLVPEDDVFTLRLKIKNSNIVSEVLFSCLDKQNLNSFVEYSVIRNRNLKINIIKSDSEYHFVAVNSINPDNEIVLSEMIKFEFEAFSSKITYDETLNDKTLENFDLEDLKLTQELGEGDTFSVDQNAVFTDKISKNVNGIKIHVSCADNEPFEDSVIKGTPWLYDFLHKKLGLTENKLYKFEGTIKRNSKYYSISFVRVSEKVGSTEQGADIGTVQFIFTPESKFSLDERNKEGESKDLVFGITIHPIVKNGEIYQYYAESDNLDKSIIDEQSEDGEVKDYPITELDGILVSNDTIPVGFTQNYIL